MGDADNTDPRIVIAERIAALLPADDFLFSLDVLLMQIVVCLHLAPDSATRQKLHSYVVGFLTLPLDALAATNDLSVAEQMIHDHNRGRAEP